MIINGTINDDGIVGTPGNDIILGGNGNDIIDGGEGNDYIEGVRSTLSVILSPTKFFQAQQLR
jgi:Ca2+-binding RTX toxin-like protein